VQRGNHMAGLCPHVVWLRRRSCGAGAPAPGILQALKRGGTTRERSLIGASGYGAAWQRIAFGTRGSQVQILLARRRAERKRGTHSAAGPSPVSAQWGVGKFGLSRLPWEQKTAGPNPATPTTVP
jgi:hypothetical protein